MKFGIHIGHMGGPLYQAHFGRDPRGGFLRGTVKQSLEMVGAYRDAGGSG